MKLFTLFAASLGIALLLVLTPHRGFAQPASTSPVQLTTPFPGEQNTIPTDGELGAFKRYIAILYRFAITLGTFMALLMIVWGGIQYATSGGSHTGIGEAKNRIKSAIYGLILLLAVVLIFRTLNPAILSGQSSSSNNQGQTPNLNTPSNVSIALLTNGNYELRWTDSSSGEDEFVIEVRRSDGSLLETLRYGGVNGTGSQVGFEITPRPGAENFRVAAAKTAPQTGPQNIGAFSNTVPAPQAQLSSTLGAPQIVTVARPSQSSIVTVQWQDRSSNESGFLIQGLPSSGLGATSPTDWIPITSYPEAQTPPGSGFSVLQVQFNQTMANGTVLTRVRVVAFRSENGRVIEQATSGESIIPAQSFSLNQPGSEPQLTNVTLEQTPLAGPALVIRWIDNSSDETGFDIYASGVPNGLTAQGFSFTPIEGVNANSTAATIPFSSLSGSPGNIPQSTIQAILQNGGQITVVVQAVGQGANATGVASNQTTITIPPQSSSF